jgi:hypothetical protein
MSLSYKFRNVVLAAAACVAMAAASSPASAVVIQTAFNFVPTSNMVADTGDVTNANTISAGAPDVVTTVSGPNNIGVVTGQAVLLQDPTPVTLGSVFTKTFTTAAGTFVETLTVTLVTPGPSSLGIQATGIIHQTVVGSGVFTDSVVDYSAAYTQNAQGQINGSFNNATSTRAIPAPIVGAGLPGLLLACGALLAFGRRRRQLAI